jgi:putative ABC transport system ATP-binding protein
MPHSAAWASAGHLASSAGQTPALECRHLGYAYGSEAALRGVSLRVDAGECVALMGPSGCGKSTLLLLAAGILVPGRGTVLVAGEEIPRDSVDARAAVRRHRVGLVFQFGDLISELTLRENVALAAELTGAGRRDALRRAEGLLERVGLAAQAARSPAQVSGGQAQRAAVARAVIHHPALVLADEPTGALDAQNADRVMTLLLDLARDLGAGVLIATHDERVARCCGRVVQLMDGGVVQPEAMHG